ncbi:hypothetical protein MMC10_008387 [Thelotrema lepadinum]|nr:hypothetical protein [Thelotrema lepadinum]
MFLACECQAIKRRLDVKSTINSRCHGEEVKVTNNVEQCQPDLNLYEIRDPAFGVSERDSGIPISYEEGYSSYGTMPNKGDEGADEAQMQPTPDSIKAVIVNYGTCDLMLCVAIAAYLFGFVWALGAMGILDKIIS